jgi:PAS domain S-box-containing protein
MVTRHIINTMSVHQRDCEDGQYLEQIFDCASEGIAVFDPERDVFADCNRTVCEMLGYSRQTFVGTEPGEIYLDGTGRFESFVESILEDGGGRATHHWTTRNGSAIPVELTASRIDVEDEPYVVLFGRRQPERTQGKTHVQKVEALARITRELLTADNIDEIARLTLDAVDDVLGYDVGCVRLFDAEENALDPVALTEHAQALVDAYQAFDLDASLAGRAYRQGDVVVNGLDDDSTHPDVAAGESIHLPLAEYGTLTVFTGSSGIPDLEANRLELLSATVTAALERDERERVLRESERELRQQHTQLDTLYQITTVIEDLIQQLVETNSREDIYQTVCDRLAGSAFFESAWVGTVESGDGRISPLAATGLTDDYLTLLGSLPIEQLGNGTVGTAIQSGSVQVVRQYQVRTYETEMTAGDVVAEQTDAGTLESVAAVPLTHHDRTYGVLVLTSSREDAFTEATQTGLDVLGDVIGFTIYAALNRELLLSDTIVELELQVTDTNCLPVAFSAELHCRCSLERTSPVGEGNAVCYLRFEDTTVEAATTAADAMPDVERHRVVDEDGETFLLEVITTTTPLQTVADLGANVPRITAEDGHGRVVIEGLPANTREIVEAFQAEFPDSELVAKREVDRPVRTAETLRKQLSDRFTPRQRTAIETAFTAGYFDWPRKSTAEEIAASMGISSPTFHQHLRKAERKLVETLLEPDDEAESREER